MTTELLIHVILGILLLLIPAGGPVLVGPAAAEVLWRGRRTHAGAVGLDLCADVGPDPVE